MTAAVTAGVIAAAAAIGASPVLAAWTASLARDERDGWWRLRRVSFLRWLVVAVVATVFAAAPDPTARRQWRGGC